MLRASLLLALAPFAAAAAPVVETSFGRLSGVSAGSCEKWLGVPFAKPPIGPLRFASPQPWTEVYPPDGLVATKAGQVCAQPHAGGENCLFLNVWRPAGTAAGAKLPVLLWIHGGSFEVGSGSGSISDACELVTKEGVVAASMNYRLGPFGFAAFEDASTRAGVSANFGIQDQREAMKWVQREVSSFGGDAAKVTIFGESAGAISVLYHLVSPPSRGLFRAVISESGIPSAHALRRATDDTRRFGARLGCSGGVGSGAALAACLRSATTEELLAAAMEDPRKPFAANHTSWWPTVDGVDMPAYPVELFAQGRSHSVPLMAGINTDEGNLFVYLDNPPSMNSSEYHDYVVQLVAGGDVSLNATEFAEVFATYPPVQGDNRPIASRVFTDAVFLCGTRFAVTAHSKHEDTFMYRFDHRSTCPGDVPLSHIPGSFHGAEIPFVFGHSTDAAGIPCLLFPEEQALSRRMQAMWANFAKDLNPTPASVSASMGSFPGYVRTSRLGRVLQTPTDGIDANYRGQYCELWDDLVYSKLAHADGREATRSIVMNILV